MPGLAVSAMTRKLTVQFLGGASATRLPYAAADSNVAVRVTEMTLMSSSCPKV